MSEKGEYLGEQKKRMLAGTGIQTSPVDVYIFACNSDSLEQLSDINADKV